MRAEPRWTSTNGSGENCLQITVRRESDGRDRELSLVSKVVDLHVGRTVVPASQPAQVLRDKLLLVILGHSTEIGEYLTRSL